MKRRRLPLEHKKVIFHIDVNSAFLSWEAVYRLQNGAREDLREETAAVGGDMATRHGVVLAKSLAAKKYGVRTGESLVEAMRKCPHLRVVPPNHALYKKYSDAFIRVLEQYSPDVEQYSIDEAFVDMSGTQGLWGDPRTAADRIRRQIRSELGFTVNIGISENKLLAKMASDFEKPDKVHTLWKEEIPKKMWPLPVSDLLFVGKATEAKLSALGIHTIGELAKADRAVLKSHLKKHGEAVWEFANGIDVSLIRPAADNKGYGNSTTIAFDVTDAPTAKLILLSLAETVGARLRAAGVRAEVIAVGIKNSDFRYTSHQTTLPGATNITQEIYGCACRLFDELWDGTAIRLLGIHAGRVSDGESVRQLDLFSREDYEKLEKVDTAVDKIRQKYGKDSIMRASFMKKPFNHMAGGTKEGLERGAD